nr:uncharacterized protein LOC111514850 [Leptinotarsa decemlineata]
MPCCYHRIKSTDEDESQEHFVNFPSSKVLSCLFSEFEASKFMRRPFLRLACQLTIRSFVKVTEEENEILSRRFLFRAILEDVAVSENLKVKRLKRKSHKSHTLDPDEDFESYLSNLKTSHQLEDSDKGEQLAVNNVTFLRKMREKWNEHKGNCYLVEVLTGLQASIQSVCENVVLLDRVEFLKERGIHCHIEKVTDDVVSPRCFALVAFKH